MINNNSELSNNADVITEGMFSVFDNARWKKKDILSNVSSLYLQRYDYQEALEKDKSASGKVILEKAQKLFGHSENEDDPRDKIAVKNYEDISAYFEKQPVEFYETIQWPCGEEEFLEFLCDAYDEIHEDKK